MATTTGELAAKHCKPCSGETPPIEGEQLKEMMGRVEGWQLEEDKKISKTFKFDSYEKAVKFLNEIARAAQEEDHHPDLTLSYGKVKVELSTHAVKGLSENDFIMAAKIDQLPR